MGVEMRLLLAATASIALLLSVNLADAANHSHGCTGKYFYCSVLKGCCLSGEKCEASGCVGAPRGGVSCGEGSCSPGFTCGTKDGKPHCFAQ
jgi:hypothetical protein